MLAVFEFNITIKTQEETENTFGDYCIDEIVADFESFLGQYTFIHTSSSSNYAGWSINNDEVYDGSYSFKSDDINDYEVARFIINLDEITNIPHAGSVFFYCKCDV